MRRKRSGDSFCASLPTVDTEELSKPGMRLLWNLEICPEKSISIKKCCRI
jgi:hypothetical protein